jgi:hypothetical protein
VARRDFEPMLCLLPGDGCGLVGEVSLPTLLCGAVVSPDPCSDVLFGQLGAFVKRLGCTAQRRCQTFGSLLVTTRCTLNEALALAYLALVGGLMSVTLRFRAALPLLKPPGLLRGVFAVVGGSLALIRDSVALVRDSVALVRLAVALVRHPVALVRHPLPLTRHPLGHRRHSLLTTALTCTPQSVTLALQSRIIGRELRPPALNLRAEALDLGPGRSIGGFERPAA